LVRGGDLPDEKACASSEGHAECGAGGGWGGEGADGELRMGRRLFECWCRGCCDRSELGQGRIRLGRGTTSL